MRIEAVALGHSGHIDTEALRTAHRELERKGDLTEFTLWPVWPNEFLVPD
jgi:hypothetical protein